MKAEFVPTQGRIATRPFRLSDGERLCIGRGEGCDLQILDASLSRRHCELEMRGGRFILRDLGSRNGTWINGRRIVEAGLREDDIVRLGTLDFVFRPLPDRRRADANLITAVPADAGGEVQDRIDPLETSLMQLPSAFENVENFRRVQRDLSTVYRIGNVLNGERDTSVLYERVVEALLGALDADRCYLLLARPGARGGEAADLEVVAQRNGERCPETGAPFSRTIAAQAYRTGMCILRGDVSEDAHFANAESVIQGAIRSAMCAPVESPDGVLGVIYADTVGQARGFRRNDLELLAAVGRQAGIALRRLQLLDEVRQSFSDTVAALVATIEAKDLYTKGHSQRVTSYALAIGRRVGLSEEDLRSLELASLLHDVGKIGVIETLLEKPFALSDAERGVMRQHPEIGANIIAKIHNAAPISRAVRHHHERWDGGGYPAGVAGEGVPLLARIIAVADTLDAMTSLRPYRPTPGLAAARRTLLEERHRQFDARIAELAHELIAGGELRVEGDDVSPRPGPTEEAGLA